MSQSKPKLKIDIIVPVFNEESGIITFHHELIRVIHAFDLDVRIIYVNDGSKDHTQEILSSLAADDNRLTVAELSRNFGHQAALSAGLDLAEGDVVISMDGDGQHPPSYIPQMLSLFHNGYDIVLMKRIDNDSITHFKRYTSQGFYWVLNKLSRTPLDPGAADFRLMAQNAVQALRLMPEYHRFLRGMVSWMGFKTAIVPFELVERLAGESKFSFTN